MGMDPDLEYIPLFRGSNIFPWCNSKASNPVTGASNRGKTKIKCTNLNRYIRLVQYATLPLFILDRKINALTR